MSDTYSDKRNNVNSVKQLTLNTPSFDKLAAMCKFGDNGSDIKSISTNHLIKRRENRSEIRSLVAQYAFLKTVTLSEIAGCKLTKDNHRT